MKNGYLSITSISTSILGYVSISFLKLNASVYLHNISINSSFSFWFEHSVQIDILLSISLSIKFLQTHKNLNCAVKYSVLPYNI